VTPEPIELRVTRWKCAFCSRSWSRKPRAAEHLSACWKNPAARSCGTCRHYHEGEVGGWDEPGAPSGCDVGRAIWITPDGYTDLNVHPRDCAGWEAS